MNWSLLLSGLALCVSLGTVIYVQRRTDRREVTKWRRDTLTKAVIDHIETLETILSVFDEYLKDRNPKQDFSFYSNRFWKLVGELDKSARLIRLCEMSNADYLLNPLRTEVITKHVDLVLIDSNKDDQSVADWLQTKSDHHWEQLGNYDRFKPLERQLKVEVGMHKRKMLRTSRS
ncbi:hypothetical protein [Rhodococcoides fascians]|uniref:hypothetical protein n=1 Tax=Rhodococcoides fascians TaxID=1828 RepID=UPI001427D72C